MSTIVQYVFVYFYTIWSGTKEIFPPAKLPYISAQNDPSHAETSYMNRSPLSKKSYDKIHFFDTIAGLK